MNPGKIAPSYNILPDEKIIAIRFHGEITGEEVKEASKVVCADERYQHGYDGIIDATKVLTRVNREQIQNLVEFSISKRKHGYGKWVILVNTPAATAYAMIYHKEVGSKHFFSICCSLEGASDLLGREIDKTWIDENLPE